MQKRNPTHLPPGALSPTPFMHLSLPPPELFCQFEPSDCINTSVFSLSLPFRVAFSQNLLISFSLFLFLSVPLSPSALLCSLALSFSFFLSFPLALSTTLSPALSLSLARSLARSLSPTHSQKYSNTLVSNKEGVSPPPCPHNNSYQYDMCVYIYWQSYYV